MKFDSWTGSETVFCVDRIIFLPSLIPILTFPNAPLYSIVPIFLLDHFHEEPGQDQDVSCCP